MNSEIHMTKEYSLFKRIKGNRELSQSHINNLVEVFTNKPDLLSYNPILVNEKMEVIDGQHRLAAAQEAGVEVFYIIHKSLDINDVQDLNSGTRHWGLMDYALSYKELGKLDYAIFVDMVQKYNVSHNVVLMVLSNEKSNLHQFKSGNFHAHDVQRAAKFFDSLFQFEGYYDAYRTGTFATAFWKMFNNVAYNHEHLLNQLRKKPEAAHKQEDVAAYLRELEYVYNDGAKAANQIRFF